MRLRGEILILLAVFVVLALLIAFGPGNAEEAPSERGTTRSSSPAGALALYRWLDQIGYATERLEYRAFALSPDDDLLFILAPSQALAAEEVMALLEWVEAGGTLVLADDRPVGGAASVLRELDLQNVADDLIESAEIVQPAIGDPPAQTVTVETTARLRFERDDVAVLVSAADAPVLLGIQRGRGYIYVSSSLHLFTNAGLRNPGSAELLLNLLRRVPAGGRVIFDEVHHGFVREPGTQTLLLANPWGWAALYAVLVGAGYLAATGRRFGRPVPLREEVARRSSAEYLESMAALLRRGAKRSYLRDHYRNLLKRRLARSLGVSPTLDDDAFVTALQASGALDVTALRDILRRMNQPNIGEAELLRLVSAADELLVRR
ncbi:MAG: DUF4350 domain-containing protein [Oscillochloris sp.]|nr:DUF4350 domain-containing protein [Oscillochloris sp.]